MKISTATEDDAAAIAGLHAGNWKAAYQGILPDSYLETEVDRERQAYWRDALARGTYPVVLVARENGEMTGFIGIRQGEDEGYDFTIEHLHVDASQRSRGTGRALLAAACRELKKLGGASVCLWVFEANGPAIRFYEKLGGICDGHGTDKFAGGDAPDRRYGWRDLDALAESCEGQRT
jgi:L-amino acid N-acyltransferase YncA